MILDRMPYRYKMVALCVGLFGAFQAEHVEGVTSSWALPSMIAIIVGAYAITYAVYRFQTHRRGEV